MIYHITMLQRVFIAKFTADSEMIWCGNQKGKQSGLSSLFSALFTTLMKDSLKGSVVGLPVVGLLYGVLLALNYPISKLFPFEMLL